MKKKAKGNNRLDPTEVAAYLKQNVRDYQRLKDTPLKIAVSQGELFHPASVFFSFSSSFGNHVAASLAPLSSLLSPLCVFFLWVYDRICSTWGY